MLDYQRIVDDVRSALFSGDLNGVDFLQAAAADYALAVDQVNERLRHCGAFLRKGLRSEALQNCEIEPNLLDIVTVLDFPERDSWKELLRRHRLAVPLPLMLEVAAELNEAYAIEQPLAALLQRHRLLAMSHGPLRLRVETLRKLAEADRDSAVWDKDLRTFERERLRELQQEVPQAIAASDAEALTALAEELGSRGWREPPPGDLVRRVTAAQAELARQQGRIAIARVEESLYEAHVAFDVEAGFRHRQELNEVCARWPSSVDQELMARIGPALRWLEEQEQQAERESRQEAATVALEQGLSNDLPTQELTRLYRKARSEGDILRGAENRYRELLAARQRSAARRKRWVIAAVVVALLAIVTVSVGLVLDKRHQGDVAIAAQRLAKLLNDGNLDEAQNYLDQLAAESPGVADHLPILELNARLQKLLADEDVRRQSFLTAVGAVRKSLEEELPDRAALARADKLATSEEENSTVRELDAAIVKLGEAVQAKCDQDFLGRLTELRDRVAAGEKDIEAQPDSCIERLRALGGDLTKLEESSPQVSAAAKRPAELLRARLKTLDEEVRNVNARLRQEEQIAAACGDPEKYHRQLSEYVRLYPQAKRSLAFQEVMEESALWKWLAQWNRMVQTHGRESLTKFDRKAAAEQASKLSAHLKQRSGHPDAGAFERRVAHLEAIARRTNSEGEPIEKVIGLLLADPLVASAWMIQDKNTGLRYYLLEDPERMLGKPGTGGMSSFEYIVAFDLTKRRKTFNRTEFVANCVPAPQRALARTVGGVLESLTDENWESSFFKMVEAIRGDAETDSLLRFVLLQKVLAVGCQGSISFQEACGSHLASLKQAKIPPGTNWINPNDSEAKRLRPIVTDLLNGLPDVNETRNAAGKVWYSLRGPIGTEYQPIGWLRKKPDAQWECVMQTAPSGSGKLCIVRASEAAAAKADIMTVGRLDQGKAVIDANAGLALLEGRPVYLALPLAK